MFERISELIAQAQKEKRPIYQIMIDWEVKETGRSESDVIADMNHRFTVMKEAVALGIKGVTSHSGLTGQDALRLFTYIEKGQYLTDPTLLKAACYAIATNEVNSSMGLICATPTAGSSGVVPGVLFAAQERLGLSDSETMPYLFTAGAFGLVIGNQATISGASGGCQAEIGSASAMAAAALTEMSGGTPQQVAEAAALALKNMLGLTCDPLGGLVEVPCIKRNAAGAANAFLAAELALAGIESKVPCDEVILAMGQTGRMMPAALKETSLGGLAATETGKRWKRQLEE